MKYNKIYLLLAKIAISAGLIVFIIVKVNFNELINGIERASLLPLFLSLAIMPLNVLLQYVKWKIAADQYIKDLSKKEVANSMFVGLAAGAFTPARLGEYWGRSLIMKNKSFFSVTTATVIEKFFPVVIIIASGIIGMIFFSFYKDSGFSKNYTFYLYISILVILIISILFLGKLLKWLTEKIQKYSWGKKHAGLLTMLNKSDKKFIGKMFLVALLFCATYIFQYALLAAAFCNSYNLGLYMWAGVLVMFSKTMLSPVSISELGIREGASVYFLSAFGESPAAGFNSAIFLFFINVILPSLPGLIILLKRDHAK